MTNILVAITIGGIAAGGIAVSGDTNVPLGMACAVGCSLGLFVLRNERNVWQIREDIKNLPCHRPEMICPVHPKKHQ